jgi:hypothetical protein
MPPRVGLTAFLPAPVVMDAAPEVCSQMEAGCLAGLSIAKSADAENAGATQHSP